MYLVVHISSNFYKSFNFQLLFFVIFFCVASTQNTNATSIPVQAGQKCGSAGYNLQTCDCTGATAVCVTDSSQCTAPLGVYPVAYVNIGRCYPGKDCPAGGTGRGGLPASEGGWNEPWINLKSAQGIARAERLIQEARSKGYKSIDPDNTAEAVDTSDLRMILELAQKYGMKVSLKNEEGQWSKLLSTYPQYRQNILMVTAEECASVGDCSKYRLFKSLGIPVVHIEYANKGGNTQKLQDAIATAGGAGMLVPNERKLRGITTLGSLCVDADSITPGGGPTAEQIASLSNGQQPYQQVVGGYTGGQSTVSPGFSAQPVNYNPGAGQWKQQDFDRLQPQAQPSLMDPSKTLPVMGEKNPYATTDAWKDASSKIIGESPKKIPLAIKEIFKDPLVTASKKDAVNEMSPITKIGDATLKKINLTCVPENGARGISPVLTWGCPREAYFAEGVGFKTRGAVVGSARVKVLQTKTFQLKCFAEDMTQLGTAECTVTVRPPAHPEKSFVTGIVTSEEKTLSSFCFLTFCL